VWFYQGIVINRWRADRARPLRDPMPAAESMNLDARR
jgi:hypothetical protein